GQRERLDDVPDRCHQRQQGNVRRPGLRRLRALTRGPVGALGRGVREALTGSGSAMGPVAVPSRLSSAERARRAARGGAWRSVPVPLLVPALMAVAFLVLPLVGLLIRAPWGRLGAALSGSDATQALTLSLWTATVATAISLVIGVPLAWVLARSRFPGQRLLRALVTLPLLLPPVVGGVP